jgi:signal peptidase I
MKRSMAFRIFGGLVRFTVIILVIIAMSLAMLLIARRIFNPFRVVVNNSMYPQIKTGDAVVIKDIEASNVKIGEVIIFRDPQHKEDLVIHRVIQVEDRGGVKFFSTKGDNNKDADNWKISAGEVVGGIAVRLPGFGSFLDFITTPKGYVSCLVIPAVGSIVLVMLLALIEKVLDMGKRSAERPEGSAAE